MSKDPQYNKEYRQKNAERIKEREKAYRLARKELIKIRDKEYREREEVRSRAKEREKLNQELKAKKRAEYFEANKDLMAEKVRIKIEEHKKKARERAKINYVPKKPNRSQINWSDKRQKLAYKRTINRKAREELRDSYLVDRIHKYSGIPSREIREQIPISIMLLRVQIKIKRHLKKQLS